MYVYGPGKKDEMRSNQRQVPGKINEPDSFTHLARHAGLDLTIDGSSLPTKGRGTRENCEDLRERRVILR